MATRDEKLVIFCQIRGCKIDEIIRKRRRDESNESNQALIGIETDEILKKERSDYKRERELQKSSNIS